MSILTPLEELGQGLAGLGVLAVLAVVQGATEFLPISSSGHLVLAQSSLGVEEPGLLVGVVLHLGTLLSVLVVYRRDLRRIVAEALEGSPREVLQIAFATVPAGLAGILLLGRLEAVFQRPEMAAAGLLVTAALLVAGELGRRRALARSVTLPPAERIPTWGDVAWIGMVQAIALWPGVSRSGSTIAVGLLRGLPARTAARFSFLLSIPAILGAAVLELPRAFASGSSGSPTVLVLASLLAALVGWLALRILIAFVERGAFRWFAAYCFALGAGWLLFA